VKNIMSSAVPATSTFDARHALAGEGAYQRTRVSAVTCLAPSSVPSSATTSVPAAALMTDLIAGSAFGNGNSDPRTWSPPV